MCWKLCLGRELHPLLHVLLPRDYCLAAALQRMARGVVCAGGGRHVAPLLPGSAPPLSLVLPSIDLLQNLGPSFIFLLAASLLPGMFLPYMHCLVYKGCFLYENHCCTIYFIATQSALDSSDFGKLLIIQLLLWGDLGLLLSLLVPRK